ncbi:MAG: hypothetical protein ABIX28_08415 [Vicinamibacterales bacterium]
MTSLTRLGSVLLLAAALHLSFGRHAAAQSPSPACVPWVSQAFNGALAAKVDRPRADGGAPSARCADAATGFLPVTEYQDVAITDEGKRKKDADEVVRDALRVRLNEIIMIRVQNIETLLDRARCITRAPDGKVVPSGSPSAATASGTAGCQPRKIRLFLDGRQIDGLEPESGAPELQRGSGLLRFHLARTPSSKEHWADLLGLDLQQRSSWVYRDVSVSVGLEGDAPVPTAVTAFRLTRVRTSWLLIWLVFALLAGWIVYRWATQTDLLRDRNPIVERGQKRPYSLAQCQAAWWTFLTLVGFVFIWLVTGERDFSGSALTLLGITSGTLLGARIIDATRGSATQASDPAAAAVLRALQNKKQLEDDLDTTEKNAAAGDAAADAALPAKRAAYLTLIADLRAAHPGVVTQRSAGLLVDLLSDANGVSFHRFQMVAWAMILGLMFVTEVLARLSMPELDANLLALLGISSGTYLGLKIPEQQ